MAWLLMWLARQMGFDFQDFFLEMETKAGGYGTAFGMNGMAADVACPTDGL